MKVVDEIFIGVGQNATQNSIVDSGEWNAIMVQEEPSPPTPSLPSPWLLVGLGIVAVAGIAIAKSQSQ